MLKRLRIGKRILEAEKIHWVVMLFVQITLLMAIATAVYNNEWTIFAITTLTFALTFVPSLIEKRAKILLPLEFQIIAVIFIYASLFLGEVRDYYTRFWWWDIFLHTGSAIALGFIGFTILYIMDKSGKIKANPFLIAIFSFSFALAIGALWEIYEFSMDQLFGYNMQKTGLIDTMWDLIVDSLGALVASIFGFFYLKKREVFLFGRIIRSFEKKNPRFFKKLRRKKKRKRKS